MSEGEERTHKLKCEKRFLEDIISGIKTFELRFNDRAFQKGDILHLREPHQPESWPPAVKLKVTYVLSGYGLEPRWVALGFHKIDDVEDTE